MQCGREEHEAWLADRFRGALLGVAVGDALGAPLEGGPPRERASLADWVDAPPCPLRYTDDTHMTLATARSLIECGGFQADSMAEALAAQYEREPWRGYGPGPPRVFEAMRRGRRWEDAARALFGGSGSFGNGAAMRAAPFGLLHHQDPQQAAEVARQAARITHAHPIGQDGAGVVAAAVAEVLRADTGGGIDATGVLAQTQRCAVTGCFADLLARIGSLGDAGEGTVVQVLGNGIEAHRSVPTALHAFLRHRDSFSDAVLFALSLGGDTDTIASMTGALAGARLGVSAIPPRWSESIEGRGEILDLADRLLELTLGGG